MAKLAQATDVVALITPHSIDRPWILYEVGVARGRLEVPAFGITFGVPLDHVAGPFAQFQNSSDDEDSLTKLVLQLIRRNPAAMPREEAVRRQVAAFRNELVTIGPASSVHRSEEPTDPATVAKLFEEVKVMFRELPGRVAERLGRTEHDRDDLSTPNLTFEDGFRLLAALAAAPEDSRATAWSDFFAWVQGSHHDFVEGTGNGALEIYQALKDRDAAKLRRGLAKLTRSFAETLAAREPKIDDRDIAYLMPRAVDLMKTWILEDESLKSQSQPRHPAK